MSGGSSVKGHTGPACGGSRSSPELPDIDDHDYRLTRAEMWRSALLVLGGTLPLLR
jgi:hypothetical protein